MRETLQESAEKGVLDEADTIVLVAVKYYDHMLFVRMGLHIHSPHH